MGSVLTACLSVHQQNCCYRLRSPGRPCPVTFAHWVPEIPGSPSYVVVWGSPTSWALQRLLLHLPRGSQILAEKLPWACARVRLSAFIPPLSQHRVGTQRQPSWKKGVTPFTGADQRPTVTLRRAEEGWPARSRATAAQVAHKHILGTPQSRTHCFSNIKIKQVSKRE